MDFTFSLCMPLSPNNILFIINGLFQIQNPYSPIKIQQSSNGVFGISVIVTEICSDPFGPNNERQVLIKRFLRIRVEELFRFKYRERVHFALLNH